MDVHCIVRLNFSVRVSYFLENNDRRGRRFGVIVTETSPNESLSSLMSPKESRVIPNFPAERFSKIATRRWFSISMSHN
jgi:hypothetical protein